MIKIAKVEKRFKSPGPAAQWSASRARWPVDYRPGGSENIQSRLGNGRRAI